jgi:hypothetical protein
MKKGTKSRAVPVMSTGKTNESLANVDYKFKMGVKPIETTR